MKRTSRAICIALALVLALSLAACGSDANKDVDINALADELLNSATFGETMNPLESSVALGLYACAEGTEAVAYAGTGATAEEVAVFNCGSAEAANGYFKQGFDSVTVSLDISVLADAMGDIVKKSMA